MPLVAPRAVRSFIFAAANDGVRWSVKNVNGQLQWTRTAQYVSGRVVR